MKLHVVSKIGNLFAAPYSKRPLRLPWRVLRRPGCGKVKGKGRRYLAIVRRELPLLPVTVCFVTGQAFGLSTAAPHGTLVLCVAVLFSLFFGTRAVAVFFAGIASGWSVLPPSSPSLGSSPSYVGKVIGEPISRQAGRVEVPLVLYGEVSNDAPFTRLESRPQFLCSAVDLPWKNVRGIANGDDVVFRGRLQPRSPGWNPFSFEAGLARHGFTGTCRMTTLARTPSSERTLAGWFRGARDFVDSQISTVLGDGERGGLFLSMVFGFRNRLADNLEEAFKLAGFAHVLVIAGYQVMIVHRVVSRLGRIFPVPLVSPVLGFAGVALLVSLSNWEPSAMRAMCAIAVVGITRRVERGRGMVNTIFLSLVVMSALSPGCVFEPAVDLTYGALFGIAAALSREPAGATREGSKSLVAYLRVSAGASLGTALPALLWFHQFSPGGLLLTILLLPAFALVNCEGGLLATTLLVTGIDRQGLSVRAISFIQCVLTSVIVTAAKISWLSGIVNGGSFVGAFLLLLALWGWQVLRVMQGLGIRFGIIREPVDVTPHLDREFVRQFARNPFARSSRR